MRVILVSVLCLFSVSLNAQFGNWNGFFDYLWDIENEENTPRAIVEFVSGSDSPKKWTRYNELGNRVSGFNFKFDWTSNENKLVGADSLIYDEEGNHIQSIYYEGSGSGPVAVAEWEAVMENGRMIQENKESYGYESLSWQKYHTFDKNGNLTESLKYAPDKKTGEVEEVITHTYDDKGNMLSKKVSTTMFGMTTEKEFRYEYDEAGNKISQTKAFSGMKEMIIYSHDLEGNLVEINTYESFDGKEYDHVETGLLYYNAQGNPDSIRISGVKSPEYYYHVDFTYSDEHTFPIRQIVEFPGSSRIYSFDTSYLYLWWD